VAEATTGTEDYRYSRHHLSQPARNAENRM